MTKTRRNELRRAAEEDKAAKKAARQKNQVLEQSMPKRWRKGKWAVKDHNPLRVLAVGLPPLQHHGTFVPTMTTTERHREDV